MITRSGVLQLEVLIRKHVSINGLSSGSIVIGEVSTLQPRNTQQCNPTETGHLTTKLRRKRQTYLAHKLRDHPVENGSFITKATFSSAQSSEVFCGEHDLFMTLDKHDPRDNPQGSKHKKWTAYFKVVLIFKPLQLPTPENKVQRVDDDKSGEEQQHF